jgi:hypothetical protein
MTQTKVIADSVLITRESGLSGAARLENSAQHLDLRRFGAATMARGAAPWCALRLAPLRVNGPDGRARCDRTREQVRTWGCGTLLWLSSGWLSSGCWKIVCLGGLGFWPGQNLVELAGDVPLQATDDLFLGQAFGGAALHVGAGPGVVGHAGDGDHVKGTGWLAGHRRDSAGVGWFCRWRRGRVRRRTETRTRRRSGAGRGCRRRWTAAGRRSRHRHRRCRADRGGPV